MSGAADLSSWGLTAPLATCGAQDLSGRAALFTRALLLAVVWWVHAKRGGASGRRWIAAVGTGFVASLEIRALFVPFVLLSMAGIGRSKRAFALGVAIVALCLVAGTVPGRAPEVDHLLQVDADPAAQTLLWSARDNVFRTRFWAARWAATEHDPGSGRLALARADWALGRADEARRLARQVAAEAVDAQARQRASDQLAAWTNERR